MPVTSRQLNSCGFTFVRIQCKAFLTLAVPGAPKNITFTSAAMKKKFQPAAWTLRSSAKPSSPWTTLHLPEQGSVSSPRYFVIRGRSSIRIVPTSRVGVTESSCAQNRARVTNSTSDASISVPKVNSTTSLSRSGFISSSGCMWFLLAATARSQLVGQAAGPRALDSSVVSLTSENNSVHNGSLPAGGEQLPEK